MEVADTWHEADSWSDPLTGRRMRRLSSRGLINQTPTYHTNSGFSADGRFLVFASVREGATWVIRAEVETNDLTAVWRAPGIGDRSYIHRGMGLSGPEIDGRGVAGNRLCMAPKSGLAVFTCEQSLLAVDIHTYDVRVLVENIGIDWILGAPCVSPDERHVAIALSSAHPELKMGQPATRPYTSFPDHTLRLIRVPLSGKGEPEVLYEHRAAQSAHCAYCPTDDNLLYFDLDLAPGYWNGGDGKTPRIWLLDIDAFEARPLKRDYPGPFQVHQAWLWDGSAIAYHGFPQKDSARSSGVYVGVTHKDGHTIWERSFPEATFYGHLTPDPKRPALILDGDFSENLLQWLYYDEDDSRRPRLEPICVHGTEWDSIPGQYSHPHPLTDPTGRWVSFNRARGGRSDVCLVDIGA